MHFTPNKIVILHEISSLIIMKNTIKVQPLPITSYSASTPYPKVKSSTPHLRSSNQPLLSKVLTKNKLL